MALSIRRKNKAELWNPAMGFGKKVIQARRGRYDNYRGLHTDGQVKGYPVELVSKLSLHRRRSSLVLFLTSIS